MLTRQPDFVDSVLDLMTLKILIIDDNEMDRLVYRRCLSMHETRVFSIEEASSAQEGLVLYNNEQFDCVLLDYHLGQTTGIEILDQIVEHNPVSRPAIVMLTGFGTIDGAADAMKRGADDYIQKSTVSVESLGRAIANAVEKTALRRSVSSKQQYLQIANEQLTKQNEEIKRFYHSVSHELKTPLTSLREFVSMVHEGVAGQTTPEQHDLLSTALESVDLLTTHLNDLTDSVSLETGAFRLELDRVDPAEVIDRTTRQFEPLFEAADINFKHLSEIGLPVMQADEARIVQVLTILLANAKKFTNAGGSVTLKSERAGPDGNAIRFSVADTGCGIEAEHLNLVFDRLYQVSKEDEWGCRAREGLGLGLSIAKQIMLQHGGELVVQSVPGEGSEFSFTVPVSDYLANVA
ncbi:MAG: ATP-binding protein [Granulosicoccaceae bacterium]